MIKTIYLYFLTIDYCLMCVSGKSEGHYLNCLKSSINVEKVHMFKVKLKDQKYYKGCENQFLEIISSAFVLRALLVSKSAPITHKYTQEYCIQTFRQSGGGLFFYFQMCILSPPSVLHISMWLNYSVLQTTIMLY